MSKAENEDVEFINQLSVKVQILSSVLTDAAISIHRSHGRDGIYKGQRSFRDCDHPFCVRVRNALDQ